jgi:hypothetical protein
MLEKCRKYEYGRLLLCSAVYNSISSPTFQRPYCFDHTIDADDGGSTEHSNVYKIMCLHGATNVLPPSLERS